jgi:hypothetical protein
MQRHETEPAKTGNRLAPIGSDLSNTSVSWRCSKATAGPPIAAYRTAPSNVPQHRGRTWLGGNKSYPDLFEPCGGFPDGVTVEDGYITMPELPGIGFEGKSDLYRAMRALTD